MIEMFVSALAPSFLVGLVLFYWERRQKKKDEQSNIHEKNVFEGEMFRIDLEVATAQLSYAVAMAVKRGYANGEMETAIAKYEEAMEKFRKFERKQMAMNANE